MEKLNHNFTNMVLTKVPGTHGQHGHVHGETAGQEGCAGDEHPGTEQRKQTVRRPTLFPNCLQIPLKHTENNERKGIISFKMHSYINYCSTVKPLIQVLFLQIQYQSKKTLAEK